MAVLLSHSWADDVFEYANQHRTFYSVEACADYYQVRDNDGFDADMICLVDNFATSVIAISKKLMSKMPMYTPAKVADRYALDLQNIIIEESNKSLLSSAFEGYKVLILDDDDESESTPDMICMVDHFSSMAIAISKNMMMIERAYTPAKLIDCYGLDEKNLIIEEHNKEELAAVFKDYELIILE